MSSHILLAGLHDNNDDDDDGSDDKDCDGDGDQTIKPSRCTNHFKSRCSNILTGRHV